MVADGVTTTYLYDAFGNQLNTSTTDTNPFRYCGEYYDSETGNYYLRARYYDPTIGRFTQEDTHWNTGNMIYGDSAQTLMPQPLAIRQAGNLYGYAVNNPVMYADPTGNSMILTCILIGVGVGLFAGAAIGHEVAMYNGYDGTNGWDYWKYVTGFGLGGGVLGGLAGWGVGAIASAGAAAAAGSGATMTWAQYQINNPPGTNPYSIGRTFERWFYETHNIIHQQVTHNGYRLDGIHGNYIIELKNYNWSNYSSYSGLINRFTSQAGNYMNLVGQNIRGQTIEGVIFYFSSRPPDEIVQALNLLNIIVDWVT